MITRNDLSFSLLFTMFVWHLFFHVACSDIWIMDIFWLTCDTLVLEIVSPLMYFSVYIPTSSVQQLLHASFLFLSLACDALSGSSLFIALFFFLSMVGTLFCCSCRMVVLGLQNFQYAFLTNNMYIFMSCVFSVHIFR